MQDGDWEVVNEPGVIVMTWCSRVSDEVQTYEFPEVRNAKDLRDMLDLAIWEHERRMSDG